MLGQDFSKLYKLHNIKKQKKKKPVHSEDLGREHIFTFGEAMPRSHFAFVLF